MPATVATPTTPHSHIELPAFDCGLRRVRRFAFAMVSSLDYEGDYRRDFLPIRWLRPESLTAMGEGYFAAAVDGLSFTAIVTCPLMESLDPRLSRLLTAVLLDMALISQASAMLSSRMAQPLAATL